MDEEEDSEDIQDVMQRLDDLELQVGVIDLDFSELTSMAHGMNTKIVDIHQDIKRINHKLLAYFQL